MFDLGLNDIGFITLLFLRAGGVIFTLPVFGDTPTPLQTRALIALSLTFVLFPIVPQPPAEIFAKDIYIFAGMGVKELLIGLGIGFFSRLVFDSIVLAAKIVGFQMGFGTATLFMADAGMQLDAFSALHRILMILIFFVLGLHHLFIIGIHQSFHILPVAAPIALSSSAGALLIKGSAEMLLICIQLAAPVLIALMFAMGVMGLMARAVPQLNIFTLSFPVSFFLGLFIYLASIPLYPKWIKSHMEGSHIQVLTLMHQMKPQ